MTRQEAIQAGRIDGKAGSFATPSVWGPHWHAYMEGFRVGEEIRDKVQAELAKLRTYRQLNFPFEARMDLA